MYARNQMSSYQLAVDVTKKSQVNLHLRDSRVVIEDEKNSLVYDEVFSNRNAPSVAVGSEAAPAQASALHSTL
jgi:hypothetical protein